MAATAVFARSSKPSPLALTSASPDGVRLTPPNSPIFNSPCGSNRKGFVLPGVATSTKAPTQSCPVTQPASAVKTSSSSKRKALGKGCGLLDWIRLSRKTKDLAGTGGKHLQVTLEELAKHNTEEDAWTAIRGKVYNITPYMKFHPGGKEDMMKGAGKDCTILFDDVHKWVNVESMLAKCVVGTLVVPSPSLSSKRTEQPNFQRERSGSLTVPRPTMILDGMNKQAVPRTLTRNDAMAAQACEETDGTRQASPESPVKLELPGTIVEEPPTSQPEDEGGNCSVITLPVPVLRPRRNSDASRPNPRLNWVDSEKNVTIHISTQYQTLKPSDIVVDVNGKTLEAEVFLNDWVYELNIALAHSVCGTQVSVIAGKVEIALKKTTPHETWETLGTYLPGHAQVRQKKDVDPKFHSCTVEDIKEVTHDTKVYTIRFPAGSYLSVPTGHHVTIRATVNDEVVERSYTPVLPLAGSSQSDGSTLQFMIKLYADGKMSQFLSKLKSGDTMSISGPDGSFDASRLSSVDDVLLIAAGTGFTPMVKVIRDTLALEDSSGTKKSAKILFANKREKDILWRSEMDQLAKKTPGFSVVNILSSADSSWSGLRGRIDSSLLKEHLSRPAGSSSGRKTFVGICGPTPFTAGISNMLLDMDYPDELVHCFT